MPGGVLFEITTEAPGFAIDNPVEKLGKASYCRNDLSQTINSSKIISLRPR